jgi:uncharacterized membrane protein YvbJ
MSYCPKCGNEIEERMVFCPRCGTSLKSAATPVQESATESNQNEKVEKSEKQERNQNQSKAERHDRSEYSFVGYLMGGLILITIAVFALLDLSHPSNSTQDLAAMLLIIGVIIISGAIYIYTTAHKRFPAAKSD